MNPISQIKVTVPTKTRLILKEKAESLGMNLSAYVKLLIQSDIKDFAYPEYIINPKVEKIADKALKDYKAGKLKSFKTIEELDEIVANYGKD